MKKLFIILWFLAASCGSIKHTSSSVTITKDSTQQRSTDTALHVRFINVNRYQHDTIIKTVYQYLHDTLHAIDLQPVTNAAGKKIPITRHYDQGHLHADVTVLPTGDLVFNLWSDSTQTLVHGLIETNSSTIDSNSHSHAEAAQHSHSSTDTEKSYTKIVQSFFATCWPYLLAAAIGIVLILFIKSKMPRL